MKKWWNLQKSIEHLNVYLKYFTSIVKNIKQVKNFWIPIKIGMVKSISYFLAFPVLYRQRKPTKEEKPWPPTLREPGAHFALGTFQWRSEVFTDNTETRAKSVVWKFLSSNWTEEGRSFSRVLTSARLDFSLAWFSWASE